MAHGWRTNWPLFAGAAWVIGLLGLGVEGYLKPTGRTVFDIYRIAGRMWWDGEDLYGYHQATTREIYRYSPAFTVAEAPFVLLPPGAGNALWKVVNGGAFAIAVWVWCRRGLSFSRDQAAAALLLCIPGSLQSLHIGQANLLMTAFVLLGLTAAVEERWWLAAGCVAAATLVKVFPFALAMVLAVLFWRTFPWRFAVSLLAGLALPFATQRPEYVRSQTAAWFRHMVESTELNRDRLRSLDKVLEVLGAGVGPKAFLLIGAAAGAVVLGVALGLTRRGVDRRGVLWQVGAWFLTWAVLFGPSTENPTFSILAPVVAAAVVKAFGRPGAWVERVWLLAALYLIGLSTTDAGGPLRDAFHTYFGTTAGAGMLQVWLIVDVTRTYRSRLS